MGIKYSTSLVTIAAHSDCILNKMFNGSFSLNPSFDGSYFIDRNGKYFEYVLAHLPEDIVLINNLSMEADYFQLPSLKKQLLANKKSLLFKQSVFGQSKILKQEDIEFLKDHIKEDFDKSSLFYQGRWFDFEDEAIKI